MATLTSGTRAYRIDSARYSIDDLRHIAYHVRLNRAGALFARCWLFVEGETEAWLLPELAQLCGYDFPTEGIRCVEFAQSGLRSLLRLANDLDLLFDVLAELTRNQWEASGLTREQFEAAFANLAMDRKILKRVSQAARAAFAALGG